MNNVNNIFAEMTKNFTEMSNNWTKNYNTNNMVNQLGDMGKFTQNFESLNKLVHSSASCAQALTHVMMENVKRQADSCSEMLKNNSGNKHDNGMNGFLTNSYKLMQKTMENNMECMREVAEIFSKTTSQNVEHLNQHCKETVKKAQDNMEHLKKKTQDNMDTFKKKASEAA